MNQVEDKRKELFDKWFNTLPWVLCEKCSKEEHIAWIGFNAALDSIEIELPNSCKMTTEELDEGYNAGYLKWEMIDAIKATGLGIKIK